MTRQSVIHLALAVLYFFSFFLSAPRCLAIEQSSVHFEETRAIGRVLVTSNLHRTRKRARNCFCPAELVLSSGKIKARSADLLAIYLGCVSTAISGRGRSRFESSLFFGARAVQRITLRDPARDSRIPEAQRIDALRRAPRLAPADRYDGILYGS